MTTLARTVTWTKCGDGGIWCPFQTVNLREVNVIGVYVVGYDQPNGIATIYVGQGDIADRLMVHRYNQQIIKYGARGTLRCTWTSVPANIRDGVERYLANKLKPLEGSQHPRVTPVPVNLPQDWY